MILTFFLFRFIVSPLVKGQDPYAILGIDRHATQDQIKKAFRTKTHKFHPDKYKGPDAQKKWVQISDAYELLKDPKKKERYDKFGLIDDSLEEKPKGPNRADKIRTILAQDSASRSRSNQQYGEFDYRKKIDIITEMTDNTFSQLTHDEKPWLICAYESDFQINEHKSILEDLFQKTGFLFGIGKLKVSSNPKTVQFLNVKTTPKIILYDPKANQFSHFSGNPTLRSVTRFASQKFGAEVTIVHDDNEILLWRKSELDRLHVILFSDLKEVPSSFEIVAAFLKRNAVFAFASINQLNLPNYPRALGSLELSELPTYIIYRMGHPKDDTFGGPVIPIVAPMDLDAGSLSAIIRRYNYPVFSEVNSENFDRLCSEYIIIYVYLNGSTDIAEDIKVGVNDMNIPTGTINGTVNKEFVNKFQLEEGDFIVMKLKSKQYIVWKEVTTWREFSDKFELMKHGLLGFKKVDQFPNFSSPIGFDKKKRNAVKFNEKINDIKFAALEKADDISAYLKKLPTIVVIGLLALILIIIVEFLIYLCSKFCCCCSKSSSSVDEKDHVD
ncbi:hypothetical protein M9Y10_008997 [Tritrichomonas musculus]|uniref:J domain-containing protein n=1 Tax=Tritrichomonas musculus TaxID=1915356 RepID=A0ABR2IZK9_9EUKA